MSAIFIIISVILFFSLKKANNEKAQLQKTNEELNKTLEELNKTVAVNEEKYQKSGFRDYESSEEALETIKKASEAASEQLASLQEAVIDLEAKRNKTENQIKTNEKKLSRMKELFTAIEYSLKKYADIPESTFKIPDFSSEEVEELVPSVTLHIHSMDTKDLLKAFKENGTRIDEITEQFKSRYTTKANQAIYSLMVIALRAELQNVLYDLKYQKLDAGIENVKKITDKYLKIACDGNQSIAPTMTNFIGQMEYLFINAVKIEYSYYVRKEQARQEQIAIRERLRQEAAERKALEEERKKIENEESKFIAQIEDIQAKIEKSDDADKDLLNMRLAELETQLSDVTIKKDEIVNLQNGKAGTVYIISNLGSFGENMFKIGMTRRKDPQERVDELGDASVPFEFDVHSFIFSDDAVALENELHKRLSEKRVNKVNMRKEFFYSSIEELEKLTHEISPTAEFNCTMVAEEYKQSLSTANNYDILTNNDSEKEE